MHARKWVLIERGLARVDHVSAPPSRMAVFRRQRLNPRIRVLAVRVGKKDQVHIQGYVQASPPPSQLLTFPWYIKAPMALLGLIAVTRIFKAFTRRDRGYVCTSASIIDRAQLYGGCSMHWAGPLMVSSEMYQIAEHAGGKRLDKRGAQRVRFRSIL